MVFVMYIELGCTHNGDGLAEPRVSLKTRLRAGGMRFVCKTQTILDKYASF